MPADLSPRIRYVAAGLADGPAGEAGARAFLDLLASPPAQRTFAAHDVHREYWTLVEGHPDPASATIDAPIVRSRRNRTTFTTGDGGRRAVTHYDTLAAHRGTAELAVRLETGRTHQVRVHLRAIGRPVAGDLVYGADPTLSAALGLDRPALHARRLRFSHPVTGEEVDHVEPLPEDLERARSAAVAAGDAASEEP